MQYGFSLGSNLGDRAGNLSRARQALLAVPHTRELSKSSLWETEPVDVRPEFMHLKFMNAVLIVESPLTPSDWLAHIAALESQFGRSRVEGDKNAPREIDVDIIFAGEELIGSGGLTVPHPRWAQRRFVVQPLAELQPGRVLPGTRLTVAQILESLPGADELTRLDTDW